MSVDGTDLLVAIRRGPKGPNTLLLDPQTGQVRRDLANWLPLGGYRRRRLAVWTAASWLFCEATGSGGQGAALPLDALGELPT